MTPTCRNVRGSPAFRIGGHRILTSCPILEGSCIGGVLRRRYRDIWLLLVLLKPPAGILSLHARAARVRVTVWPSKIIGMNFRKTALACTLAFGCWFIAHALNAYVSHALLPVQVESAAPRDAQAVPPPDARPDPKEMAKVILTSGLFVVPVAPAVAEEDGGESAPPAPPIELAGKLKLLGTAIRDGGRSSAAIEHLSDHKQTLYFLDDTIDGFGRLAIITRNGVTIRQGNREGYLPLDDGAAKPVPISIATPARRPAGPLLIDRRQLKQNLSDVSKLLTEARAMPYYDLTNNGTLDGWQIIDIKPKSILDQLGIEQRDVILRINGTSVTDPGTMLRLLQELQFEQNVKVDVIRHGARQTLAYEIR